MGTQYLSDHSLSETKKGATFAYFALLLFIPPRGILSISVGKEGRPSRKKEIKGVNERGKHKIRMVAELQVFEERSRFGKRRN